MKNGGKTMVLFQHPKALQMADDAGLDLVLISPNQAPPVAKDFRLW